MSIELPDHVSRETKFIQRVFGIFVLIVVGVAIVFVILYLNISQRSILRRIDVAVVHLVEAQDERVERQTRILVGRIVQLERFIARHGLEVPPQENGSTNVPMGQGPGSGPEPAGERSDTSEPPPPPPPDSEPSPPPEPVCIPSTGICVDGPVGLMAVGGFTAVAILAIALTIPRKEVSTISDTTKAAVWTFVETFVGVFALSALGVFEAVASAVSEGRVPDFGAAADALIAGAGAAAAAAIAALKQRFAPPSQRASY